MSEIRRLFLAIGILLLATRDGGAERINQEGRILGRRRSVDHADFIQHAASRRDRFRDADFSGDESVERRHFAPPGSRQFGDDDRADQNRILSSSRQTLRPFYEMNYVLVPDNQARVTISFLDYPDESDLDGGAFPNGSYPIPSNMPIETWPVGHRQPDSAAMANGRERTSAAIAMESWSRRESDRFGKRGR